MADTTVCMCLTRHEADAFVFLHIRVVFQMTQNMFQEGLYHVFFKDSPRGSAEVSSSGVLTSARIHRWFGTVVNTRLLVSGVRDAASQGFPLPIDTPPPPPPHLGF